MSRLLIRVLALSCIAECFILCPSPKVRPASAAPPPGYVLVWSDEFNGTALDLTKWGHLHPGLVRNGRNAVQAIDAVSVSGGNLVIRTYSDYDPTNPDPPLPPQHYTGMIQTGGDLTGAPPGCAPDPDQLDPPGNKYMPLYGYIEASIHFDGESGMWHSFFVTTPKGLLQGPMLPQDRGMEMDIVEHKKIQGSGQPGDPAIDVSNQADAARHWFTQNSPVCPSTPDVLHAGSGRVGTGLADGFHTYGLEWTPEFLKYYYDGIVVWAVNNSADTPVSHTNEYILLCGEVPLPGQANAYGSLPPGGFGPRGASNNPKMTVDYVRVYQDVVPPAVVTDLSVPSVAKNNVAVSWTAPGDDGTGQQVTEYDLRYSSSPITALNFDSATRVTTSAPNISGWKECSLIGWLSCGTKYFAIKSKDEAGNWSGISNVPSAAPVCGGPNILAECPAPEEDTTAPVDVADLSITSIGKLNMAVSWTAPGDDGTTGTASEYDFRYSTSTINASNFGSATRLPIHTPNAAGSGECQLVEGLPACTMYYFALKTRDEWGNWSGISNVPNATTVCVQNILAECNGGGGAAKRPVPNDETPRVFSCGPCEIPVPVLTLLAEIHRVE